MKKPVFTGTDFMLSCYRGRRRGCYENVKEKSICFRYGGSDTFQCRRL